MTNNPPNISFTGLAAAASSVLSLVTSQSASTRHQSKWEYREGWGKEGARKEEGRGRKKQQGF